MEIPADVLGFVVVVATMLGAGIGLKVLVWGKGPIRRLRAGAGDSATDERLAELEDRVQRLSDLVADQSQLLEDHHERLDFTERVLTQQRGDEPKGLNSVN